MLEKLVAYPVEDNALPKGCDVAHHLDQGCLVVAFRKSAPLMMILAAICLELARMERNPE